MVENVGKAKSTVLVQAYSFTSAPIAKALVDAAKRGVKVQVILDKSQRTEKYSGADFLLHEGVPTYIDDKHAIAHNKIMVIDSRTILTGSFNFTKAAESSNAENLLVIDDAALANKYAANWEKHLEHSEPYTDTKGTMTGHTAKTEAQRMKEFEQVDRFHLSAAQGWFGLGDLISANDELEQIAPEFRVHPAVLFVRFAIYSKGEKWDGAAEIANTLTKVLPDSPAGWIDLAYSTRRRTGGGIPQAKEILTEAKAKFPNEYLISFNLACYECQLGNLSAAKQRLKEAFDLAGKKDIRLRALKDPDLEPLWNEIGSI